MRIVAADTGGALLREDYEVVGLIATSAVLVEKPYKTANLSVVRYANPFEYDLSGKQAIGDEIELAIDLARKVKPDVVHIDSTLGGIELRKLDEPTIEALPISDRGKDVWIELSKKYRKKIEQFWREGGIELVAIGKWSVPVRIAEIYSGIYAALWGVKRIKNGWENLLIGLPRYMTVELEENQIFGRSLDPREGDLHGKVKCECEGIGWELYPNPLVRRYMVLEMWRE